MADSSIAIAVTTWKRPASLALTLASLKEIAIPECTAVRLIVIDNDKERSAQETVRALQHTLPFPVSCLVEEKRGIPHARNKALSAAAADDYLAFIDDDDTADPQWLLTLYSAMQRFGADVVKGRVNYQFAKEAAYLGKLDIFANPTLPTGSELDSAWTNNVLLATRIYKETRLQFDVDFIDSGGSDHHFFRSAKNNGARIILCQEAVVNSPVPPRRTRLTWLALRTIRVGATMTISDIKTGGYRYALTQAAHSLKSSARYCARLIPGVFTGKNPAIHPLLVIFFMLGRIAGLFHLSPRPYGRA